MLWLLNMFLTSNPKKENYQMSAHRKCSNDGIVVAGNEQISAVPHHMMWQHETTAFLESHQ
jgi:hypothetical protein